MPAATIDAAVREACLLLEAPETAGLTVDELARRVHVSPDYLADAFKTRTGVTPREYRESLRLQRLQEQLRAQPGDVAGAAFAAGFGSLSSAYETSTRYLGMTPATYGARGAGAQVRWSITPTRFGELLISATERGLATVYLGPDPDALQAALREELPAAELTRDDRRLAPLAELVAAFASGEDASASLLPPRRARHRLSVAGMARAARDPTRADPLLRTGGRADRLANLGARRRPRLRHQSRRNRDALPPRGAQRRLTRRLPLGPGTQSRAAQRRAVDRDRQPTPRLSPRPYGNATCGPSTPSTVGTTVGSGSGATYGSALGRSSPPGNAYRRIERCTISHCWRNGPEL